MANLSENAIAFYGAGGHNHDGVGSTLIDISKYSIFDFSTGFLGSQPRINNQSQNQKNLESWIVSVVNSQVLAPSGLSLKVGSLNGKSITAETITSTQIKAKTITANEIAASTITADEIVAKTITGAKIADNAVGSDQVNNIMSIINLQSDFVTTNATMVSTDYNGTTPGTGSAGWSLWANGDAEFNDIYVRGTVDATSGSIGAYSINSSISSQYIDAGIYTNRYTMTLSDTARLTSRLEYDIYGLNNVSNVYINAGSAIDGASIIVNSSSGSNTYITPGVISVNNRLEGPMKPTLAVASNYSALGVSGGGYINHFTSLREYKYDIEDYDEYGLIDSLRPRKFKWKNIGDSPETEYEKEMRESQYAIGFIAEEVESIENGRFSTYFGENREKLLFWKMDNIIAILVAEVQDLRKRVYELENEV